MSRGWTIVAAAALTLLPPSLSEPAEAGIGTVSSPLTVKNSAVPWTANGNVVPVCWETVGYAREKAIVQAAVAGTWAFYSNLQFTGWGACPTSGPQRQIRIHINAFGKGSGGAVGVTNGYGMDLLSAAADNKPAMDLGFTPDGSANLGRVEYVAVHEFGHVLGFVHEQDTPGNVEGPAYCKSPGNEPDSKSLTAYDRDSIMNYCNRDGNIKGNLTDTDIRGVQALYGVRIANIAARNSCASSSFKQTASVAWAWNDGSGQTSIALFPTDHTKFSDRAVWSLRQGGWGDEVKWFAGDFNGDGQSDIGGAWNDGGQVSLAMRQSTGSGFTLASWATRTGGWINGAVWLPGDYNGDGLTDVAGLWNDHGQVSIVVYLSDGKKFLNPTVWAARVGGWGDEIKWFAGDFDGDGRTDIGGAWNNGGKISLVVRRSTGRAFTPVEWTKDAGDWNDATIFLAGDFNGDGRADVARIWDDVGRNSIAVSLSNGSAFRAPVDWSIRDGGWIQGDAVKWFEGDFNGDGRTDIGAAWDNDNLNTLTVRQSTGGGFTAAHWAIKAGGWRDSAAWCSGRFQVVAQDPAASPGGTISSRPSPFVR